MITTLTCNACLTAISPTGTRIICCVWANYDLCSNCHTHGRFSDSHGVQHETLVLYSPSSISRDCHVPSALLPPPPPRSDNSGEISPRPRPAPLAACIPTGISLLLSRNKAPSKRLKDISDAVFAYMNKTYPSANEHLLNPGQLSNFYKLIGRRSEENLFGVWINIMNVLGRSLDDIDPEIAHIYDRVRIQYLLIPRAAEGVPWVAVNSMPVLSYLDFRQLLVYEIRENPESAHSFFKRLVHLAIVDDNGQVFTEVSRVMFPAGPDPAFVAEATAVSEELSERARMLRLIARSKSGCEEEGQRKERALTEQEEMRCWLARGSGWQSSRW